MIFVGASQHRQSRDRDVHKHYARLAVTRVNFIFRNQPVTSRRMAGPAFIAQDLPSRYRTAS